MGLIRGLVVEVVGHDGALDVIAGVDEDGVGILRPDLLDVGVEAGHAVVVGFLVVLVGVAPDIAVHIRGAQDGEVGLPLPGCEGSGCRSGQHGGRHGGSEDLAQGMTFHKILSFYFR